MAAVPPSMWFSSSPQTFLGHFIWDLKIAAVEMVATREDRAWMDHGWQQNSAPPVSYSPR